MATPGMSLAHLPHRFMVQKREPHGAGHWITTHRAAGDLSEARSREDMSAGQVTPASDHRALVRREGVIAAGDRLVLGTRQFQVVGLPVIDPASRLYQLKLAEESTPWDGLAQPRAYYDASSDVLATGSALTWQDRVTARVFGAAHPAPLPVRAAELHGRGAAAIAFAAGISLTQTSSNMLAGLASGTIVLAASLAPPTGSETSLLYVSGAASAAERALEVSVTTAGLVRVRLGSIDLVSASPLQGQRWHLIAVRWAADQNLELRVDDLRATASLAGVPPWNDASAAEVRLGWKPATTTPENLLLGELAIYRRRLSDSDIDPLCDRLREKWGTS